MEAWIGRLRSFPLRSPSDSGPLFLTRRESHRRPCGTRPNLAGVAVVGDDLQRVAPRFRARAGVASPASGPGSSVAAFLSEVGVFLVEPRGRLRRIRKAGGGARVVLLRGFFHLASAIRPGNPAPASAGRRAARRAGRLQIAGVGSCRRSLGAAAPGTVHNRHWHLKKASSTRPPNHGLRLHGTTASGTIPIGMRAGRRDVATTPAMALASWAPAPPRPHRRAPASLRRGVRRHAGRDMAPRCRGRRSAAAAPLPEALRSMDCHPLYPAALLGVHSALTEVFGLSRPDHLGDRR